LHQAIDEARKNRSIVKFTTYFTVAGISREHKLRNTFCFACRKFSVCHGFELISGIDSAIIVAMRYFCSRRIGFSAFPNAEFPDLAA
jgi:hypothetical protein